MQLGKIVSYAREDGARIDAVEAADMQTIVSGGFQWDEEKVPRFIGHATVGVKDHAGRLMGMQPVQFPIAASNIREAFDGFMEALQAHGEAMREQSREPKIQTPNQTPFGG